VRKGLIGLTQDETHEEHGKSPKGGKLRGGEYPRKREGREPRISPKKNQGRRNLPLWIKSSGEGTTRKEKTL